MDDKREAIRLIDNGKPRSAKLHIKLLDTIKNDSSHRIFFVDEYIGHGTSVIVYKGHYDIGEMRHDCIIKELYPDNCDIYRDSLDGVALNIGKKTDYEYYRKKYIHAYEIQLEAQSGRMYNNSTVSKKDKTSTDGKNIIYSEENMTLNSAIPVQYGIYESDSGILYTIYASNLCYPYDKYPPNGEYKNLLMQTIRENITFTLQAAKVIAAFHKAGWLILDIKEENFIIVGTRDRAGIMFIDFGSLVNKSELADSDGTTGLVSFTPKNKDDIPRELCSLLNASNDRICMCYHELARSGDTTDMYLLAAMLYRKLFGELQGEKLTVYEPEFSEQQPFFDELKRYFEMTMEKYINNRSSDDEIIKQLETLLDLSDLVDERTRKTHLNSGVTHLYTGVTDEHLYNSNSRYYDRLRRCEKFAHMKKITQKFDIKVHLLNKNMEEISANKIFGGKRHLFLKGSGGMGKSTLLYDQWARFLGNKNHCFYIDLSRYSTIDESVEKSNSLRDGIYIKPLNILAYIINNILRDNMVSLSTHLDDNDQAKSLIERFSAETIKPEYVIMLDGYNEVLNTNKLSTLNNEIDIIVHGEKPWKNVQLIITSRKLPENHSLLDILEKYFDIYSFTGITDTDVSAALERNMKITEERVSFLKKDRLWEILKTPMFLNMYLEINDSEKSLHTRGEILEEYILKREVRIGRNISFANDRTDKHALIRQFVVMYALPFVASLMDKKRESYLSTDLFYAYMKRGFDVYLNNDLVFSKYTFICNKHYADIPDFNIREIYSLISEVGNETGYFFFTENDDISFSHEFLRDYLASRHICNVLEASQALWKSAEKDNQLEFIKANGLDYVWSDAIAQMLGDITKDYMNEPEYKNN